MSEIYFELVNISEILRFNYILANVSNFNALVIHCNKIVEQLILVQLIHKAPIKTATEDGFCDILIFKDTFLVA